MPVFNTLLAILCTAFCIQAFGDKEEELADSIDMLCNFDNNYTEEEKEDCMLYYVNCSIGEGGKWTDSGLINCVSEKINKKE